MSVSQPMGLPPIHCTTWLSSPAVGWNSRFQNTEPAATEMPMVEEKMVRNTPIPGRSWAESTASSRARITVRGTVSRVYRKVVPRDWR